MNETIYELCKLFCILHLVYVVYLFIDKFISSVLVGHFHFSALLIDFFYTVLYFT